MSGTKVPRLKGVTVPGRKQRSWGLSRLRAAVWAGLDGRVLEIGAGAGANRPFYPAGARVTAFDVDSQRLRRGRSAYGRAGVDLSQSDAQALPFATCAFDTVVGTLTFGSIHDPARGLAEARRVLRPGGRLVLLEHVRGRRPPLRFLTDALQPLWFALQGECHLNRETVAAVATARFTLEAVTSHAWGLFQLIQAVR